MGKNKTSNKNKRNKPRKTASAHAHSTSQLLPGLPGAQQLVAAADHAVMHQDPDKAVQLYTNAEKKLKDLLKEHQTKAETVDATDTDVDASDAADADADADAEGDQACRQCLLQVWEKRAELKVSVEDQEGAFQDYQQALDLLNQQEQQQQQELNLEETRQRASFYLYIGQLQEGKDAVDAYRKGIECFQATLERMQREINNTTTTLESSPGTEEPMGDDEDDVDTKPVDPKTALEETRRQLAAACCSAAEVYLTDLCFEDNAEQQCEAFLEKAMQIIDTDGEPVIDALQTTASLRLSQTRGLEAVDFVLRAFRKMQVGCEALASLVGLREESNPEQATELLETDAVRTLPGYEFRCQTAKFLLECAGVLKEEKPGDAREAKCVQAAVDVLGSLLAENDEVAEIWYLMGNAFAAMNPPNVELAVNYWERTNEMLTSVKESLVQGCLEAQSDEETQDLQMHLEEVTLQVEAVQSQLAEFPDNGDDDEAQAMEE
jgi:tetratricopeptide (TPR) repeat protein